MKVSPSGQFAIDEKNEHVLFVSSTEPPHSWLRRVTTLQPLKIKDKILYPYEYFDTLYINDCLKFAEAITSGVKDYDKLKCVLREKGSRFKFGFKDETNVTIAKGLSPAKTKKTLPRILNEQANPEVGESYAIVRARPLSSEIEEVPYHIAFVLAKDGDTNITIEADAGDSDLDKPVFDMYSPRDTFHDRYKDSIDPASTIVLERA